MQLHRNHQHLHVDDVPSKNSVLSCASDTEIQSLKFFKLFPPHITQFHRLLKHILQHLQHYITHNGFLKISVSLEGASQTLTCW